MPDRPTAQTGAQPALPPAPPDPVGSPRTRAGGRPRARRDTRKHYLLDTNVLLHDPESLFRFEENTVWLPVEVLEELDRFKAETSTRGANAREVHRKLSELFRDGDDMRRGAALPNGGRIRVALERPVYHDGGGWQIRPDSRQAQMARALFPDLASPDNRILATAAFLSETQSLPTIVVTKDLNMQLKAKALGLESQDYRTDRVEDSDIRRTQRKADHEQHHTIELPPDALQRFASTGIIALQTGGDLHPNEYALLRNASDPGHGIPARHRGGGAFHRLREEIVSVRGGRAFKPANLGQRFLLDALFDPEISLVTVYGKAGTGKTLLSVGAALQQVQAARYHKLLISRVIMPTGRDIGYLPGRTEEKLQPWLQPAYDALDLLLTCPRKPEQFERRRQSERKRGHAPEENGSNGNGNGKSGVHPYEPLLRDGTVEIEAICHIRGRSIPDAIFIVDEAQQLTPHEAKTLVTRMGNGSKLILVGDLAQIDNPYVDAHTNGLVYTRNRLQGQSFAAHVNLFKGERSPMAEAAANLM